MMARRLPPRYGFAMTAVRKSPPRPMTVAEFLTWDPGDGQSERWILRDGVPEMMSPASDRHGTIQAQLAYLLISHLQRRGSPCRVVTAPGVVPKQCSDINMLSPDLGITCEPPGRSHDMPKPVALFEILSPSNHAETRANVRAFMTIESLIEIVILHSTRIAAEVLRRQPSGAWPEQPDYLGPDDTLRLDSIGYEAPLRDAYRTAGLD